MEQNARYVIIVYYNNSSLNNRFGNSACLRRRQHPGGVSPSEHCRLDRFCDAFHHVTVIATIHDCVKTSRSISSIFRGHSANV